MSSAFVSKKPTVVDVKKGSPSSRLERAEFETRCLSQFADPLFTGRAQELRAIAATAWEACNSSRKAPRTRKAGQEFSDPEYNLPVEWSETRDAIRAAQQKYHMQTSVRILLFNGSPRNEHTCPSEVSKSRRLIDLARDELSTFGVEVDFLDLSRVTSEYGRNIHPCKARFLTAPPLCHWPCSCYPNYSLGQAQDWMNEIYPMWVVAHGVMIVTPVHWFQVTSPLKLMMDRLVCADGGNADPTRTQGKDAALAKQIELEGWRYEQHLKGRSDCFSVVVHGDVEGAEGVRRSIADWLRAIGLQSAGAAGELDRMIGYWKPYATSHAELDMDTAVQREVRNAARTLLRAVLAQRAGLIVDAGADLDAPRKK
jgi:multimeric flavodoxin WrbA